MRVREPADPLVALVPEAGHFDGLVATRGDVRLEGTVEGEVLAGGRVEVGEKAQIRARIEADEIEIGGHVQGDVVARRFLELGPGAQVEGNVSTPRLAAADGSRLDGRVEMRPGAAESGAGSA